MRRDVFERVLEQVVNLRLDQRSGGETDGQLIANRIGTRARVGDPRYEDPGKLGGVLELDAQIGPPPLHLAPDLPSETNCADDGSVDRERIGHEGERSVENPSRVGAASHGSHLPSASDSYGLSLSDTNAIVLQMDILLDPTAHLCHYTRANTAFCHIVPRKRFLLNPYSDMRDPLENKNLEPSFAISDQEMDEAYLQRVRERVGRCRDDKLLLSLTQGRDEPDNGTFRCAWARPRMWEQYADNHAGVCLVFDRAELLAVLRHDLEGRGTYWDNNVHYTVGGFIDSEAAHIDLSDVREESLDVDVERHVKTLQKYFFFLKNDDWSTEFEYRIVFTKPARKPSEAPHGSPIYVSFGDSLQYVIVGEKFPEGQLQCACDVAAQKGVKLLRMTWENGSPWPHDPAHRVFNRPV